MSLYFALGWRQSSQHLEILTVGTARYETLACGQDIAPDLLVTVHGTHDDPLVLGSWLRRRGLDPLKAKKLLLLFLREMERAIDVMQRRASDPPDVLPQVLLSSAPADQWRQTAERAVQEAVLAGVLVANSGTPNPHGYVDPDGCLVVYADLPTGRVSCRLATKLWTWANQEGKSNV